MGIDEVLKQYAVAREAMRHRRMLRRKCHGGPRDPVRCLAFFFFLRVLYSIYIYSESPIKASNSKQKRSRQYQRVTAPQPPAIPILVFAFLVCCGRIPLIIAFLCVQANPHFDPSLTIFCRSTLRIILIIHKLAAAQLELNAPGSQRTRVGDQTMHRYP
jgi:hypothetical protein